MPYNAYHVHEVLLPLMCVEVPFLEHPTNLVHSRKHGGLYTPDGNTELNQNHLGQKEPGGRQGAESGTFDKRWKRGAVY